MAKQKETAEEKLTPAEESRVSAALKIAKEQEEEAKPKAAPAPAKEPEKVEEPAKAAASAPGPIKPEDTAAHENENPFLTPEQKETLEAKWKDNEKAEKDRFQPPPADLSKNVVASGISCPRCESTSCSHAGGQRHCNQCGLTWH
jgi:hypothetical protein